MRWLPCCKVSVTLLLDGAGWGSSAGKGRRMGVKPLPCACAHTSRRAVSILNPGAVDQEVW